MLYVVIIFLLVSVYLYCLLGGADFGAGIVELTARGESKERTKNLVSESMAPIWEANHMWLVITVVILFNAFPAIYTQVSISLYIPLILLLVGIVLRGTAFTFRHYDAIKDESQKVYSGIFSYSSLIVTFFFGLVIGALISGKISQNPADFIEGYVTPWLNIFSVSVGIFLCTLFSFIASVYLIGDSTEISIREEFITKAKHATIAMVISGGVVFIASFIENVDLITQFFSHPVSITLIVFATIGLPVLWITLGKGQIWFSRVIAGAQLLFILGGFYAIYFPTIVKIKDGTNLTLFNSAAPEVTLVYLSWALIIGSFIIFPSLFYLLNIFKFKNGNKTTIN
ncbi:MAG: cytochrome d ubiquinol oxidase subunit II [Ignavibacteriaceae bacterium]